MALCNQCAAQYNGYYGDITPNTKAACDGCGICITDEKGDCISRDCFEHHGDHDWVEVFVIGKVQPYKRIRIPRYWWRVATSSMRVDLAELHGGQLLGEV